MLGSSPRVRGKHLIAESHGYVCRLIPACAGKTFFEAESKVVQGAHPRVCGENSVVSGDECPKTGSSPRVRGKRQGTCTWATVIGLIPACAGKTHALEIRCVPRWAHPRVCGENSRFFFWSGNQAGSSPRVRGKRSLRRRINIQHGLIPACAGKTVRKPAPPLIQTAHPRVCGENFLIPLKTFVMTGSSPRVRGKRLLA